MVGPKRFDARKASFRAIAPGLSGFHGLAFLRGGMMAAAPRAAMASWHLRVAAHARDAFGLTPKRLARIARFHHAIDLANSASRPDWAGIAVDCGYADQAHLVRDFATFSGAPPGRWRNNFNEPSSKQIFNPSVGDHG